MTKYHLLTKSNEKQVVIDGSEMPLVTNKGWRKLATLTASSTEEAAALFDKDESLSSENLAKKQASQSIKESKEVGGSSKVSSFETSLNIINIVAWGVIIFSSLVFLFMGPQGILYGLINFVVGSLVRILMLGMGYCAVNTSKNTAKAAYHAERTEKLTEALVNAAVSKQAA